MFLITGEKLVGKADRVPGLFFVTAKWEHFWFIPIFPSATYLVFEGISSFLRLQGVQIPFSWKCAFLLWLRMLLWVAIFFGIIGIFVCLSKLFDGKISARTIVGLLATAGLTISAFTMLWLSHYLSRASLSKALRLANQVGFPESWVEQHFRSKPVDPAMIKEWWSNNELG